MIQAAARLSHMSRTVCPQASGVWIDDFLQQYVGKNETGHCINASCPASQPNAYGDQASGTYCCPREIPPGSEDCGTRKEKISACRSGPPNATDCACCLVPGTALGCQGAGICSSAPPAGTKVCDKNPMITLQDMIDIKAAVQGKTVRVDGTVDHSSVALTPHLTLGIVWYDFELHGQYQWLKKDGAQSLAIFPILMTLLFSSWPSL